MIKFKVLRYRNFLSSGNDFIEIPLDTHRSTLIVGHNGAGKSTLIDALSFNLFGKPYRKVTKPQVTNSINKKQCLTEVEFSIGNQEYKIRRGISPNIFEIYLNDNLINQESNAKDYQKLLEQNILKLNHKSFHQVIVLGSSSFTPFMQLPAAQRRSVIEDILDIGVFSRMNIIVKEELSNIKQKIADIDKKVEIVSTKLVAQNKYITDMTSINEEYKEEKRNNINKLKTEIDEYQERLDIILDKINSSIILDSKELNKQKTDIVANISNIMSSMKSIVKDIKFYEDNENCPTCNQSIDENFKKDKITQSKQQASDLKKTYEELNSKEREITESLNKVEKAVEEFNEYNIQRNVLTSNIQTSKNAIQKLEQELESLDVNTSDLDEAEKEFKKLQDEKKKYLGSKKTKQNELVYNNAIVEMLKDTGIKTKIIKRYLPVINKLVNYYLQVLDFFVSFHLNENFEEEIRSRHRDKFTYDSFSEGEKQRIDLSLLFAWRQVAKLKNSISTNLLILDETFDSSLDVDGIENLLKILTTFDDGTNIFIISHKREALEGHFENQIEFKKVKNFSKIV